MVTRERLARQLNDVMEREAETYLSEVPFASHLTDTTPLNRDYYLRHRIETVHRIRQTARIDALALARMLDEDYPAARHWGRYTCEELEHDQLYLSDLATHGFTEEQVLATPLFNATGAMLTYMIEALERWGSLAAVSYSIFVEWNSARYSAAAVEKASQAFSVKNVAGSKTHLGIDEVEDHYEVMVDIAYTLVEKDEERERALFDMIGDYAKFFRQYFTELYQSTVEPKPLKFAS